VVLTLSPATDLADHGAQPVHAETNGGDTAPPSQIAIEAASP